MATIIQYLYDKVKNKVREEDRVGNEKEQEILMGYGACYILTPNFFKFFKKLDAPNFLMGEEGVLANQVKSVQGITIYKPDLIVKHHDHASIGKVLKRKLYDYSKASYKYYLRNLKYIQ